MTSHQQAVALLIGGAVLYTILELIRQRRLREEYAVLWLVTGFVMFLMVIQIDLLDLLTHLIGVASPINAVFFLGLITVILINVHYSVKISELTTQVKNLSQELALLSAREAPDQ